MGVYPVYRIVVVTSGFKGSVLIFSLKDKVSNLCCWWCWFCCCRWCWFRATGGQGNQVEFEHLTDDSSTSKRLEKAHQLKATMDAPGGIGGIGASGINPSSSSAVSVQSCNANAQVVYGKAFGLDPGTRDKLGMYDEETGKAHAEDAEM